MKALLYLVVLIPLVCEGQKLVLIKSVSNSLKTFVISEGREDGISRGQVSLFSTENISLTAMAQEVTRNHSYWKLQEPFAKVPFFKDQIVGFSNNVEAIVEEIPLIRKQVKKLAYKTKQYWIFKFSLSTTLNQTISNLSEQSDSVREGQKIQGLFKKNISEKFSWAAGMRYDWETRKTTSPTNSIPTERFYLLGQGYYHFNPINILKSHFYSSLGIGIGRSSTSQSGLISNGPSFLIPEMIVGFNLNLSHKTAFLFELSLENIVSSETYSNGDKQSTDLLNLNLSLGLQF
jgi:hypothetical protein